MFSRVTRRDPDAAVRTLEGSVVLAAVAIAACLGLIGIAHLALHAADLYSLDEAGYGDSYILYNILHLQADGHIYRDLSKPPYLPAQYSPMLYMLLSLPGKLILLANPFLGPRLIVLAAFAGCLAVVVSITRTLTRHPWSARLSLLIAASIAPMWDWILQVRSEFIGLAFSLAAVRLLLAGGRREVWFAGLCAGMAVQMKLTLVAAAVSGFVWLALGRRWMDVARFTVGGTVTSAGLYLLYWIREPQMLAQMTALIPGVPDMPGAVQFASRAALEPVMVAALLTAPAVPFVKERRWQLLMLFAVVSAAVAVATSVQAGAYLNYYFEPFLAGVPLATAGVLLLRQSSRPLTHGLALAVIFGCVVYAILPRSLNLTREIAARVPVSERNAQWLALASVIEPYRTFSTIPRLALFDADPPLVEPFLLEYMDRLGSADHGPLVAEIRQGRSKAVFTAAIGRSYRGIPHIGPALREAIAATYVPYCVITLPMRGPILAHIPRDDGARAGTLIRGLDSLGCARVSPGEAGRW